MPRGHAASASCDGCGKLAASEVAGTGLRAGSTRPFDRRRMTLEQKVGQMTQADIRSVTPDDVRRYYIGSILNGGGAWPAMNMHSSVDDWLKLSDAFYRASMSTDMKVKVPVIWGTDAVHGHNNVYGATLFPHNIGLGAAHDPQLMRTDRPGNRRAGSSDGNQLGVRADACGRPEPALGPDLRKLQLGSGAGALLWRGDGRAASRASWARRHRCSRPPSTSSATAGPSMARTRAKPERARPISTRTHAAGYYGALKANVQTVMVSYSSFTDTATGKHWGKMHGNAHLVGDVLKKRHGVRRAGRQRLERRSGRCPAAPTGIARRRSMPGSTW